MLMVPVVDALGKPLMPCHPARARELVKKGKALRRFDHGIFYIYMLRRVNGKTQEVVVGIDPGTKKEGFTIKSAKHTFLNVQADAVTWVAKAIELRRNARKARRSRKTPYRKNRTNRKNRKLSPSSLARWNWKLRICKWLSRLYPIVNATVEDVRVKMRGQKKWDRAFAPVQIGKNWFYSEITKLFRLTLVRGFETKNIRENLGLKKYSSKVHDTFNAHCVDSWVLANLASSGHTKPENKVLLKVIPLRFHRRQLHVFNFARGSVRKLYGSTKSLGLKRGSVVKHTKYGVMYVGGTFSNKISLHCLKTGRRKHQHAIPKDCTFLTYNSWRTVFIHN